jgi:hypothetical protein
MRATARVTLRVTRVSPRIGLSWLNRDSVGGVDAVGLAVIHRDPVAVKLGDAVRRARIERRGLLLRHFLDKAIEFRGRGLIGASGPRGPTMLSLGPAKSSFVGSQKKSRLAAAFRIDLFCVDARLCEPEAT